MVDDTVPFQIGNQFCTAQYARVGTRPVLIGSVLLYHARYNGLSTIFLHSRPAAERTLFQTLQIQNSKWYLSACVKNSLQEISRTDTVQYTYRRRRIPVLYVVAQTIC